MFLNDESVKEAILHQSVNESDAGSSVYMPDQREEDLIKEMEKD